MGIDEIFAKWNTKNANKQASIDMWNSMAHSFGEHMIPSFENNAFLQLIEENKMFDSKSRVLDVGCGTGIYGLALAGRCKEVIGIDLSPHMLAIAKQKADDLCIANIEFRCMDWHEANLQKEEFDKGFNLVFAHMTPAVQCADTFQKLMRASRGWCVLSKPTRRTDPVSDAVKRIVGIDDKHENSDIDILYAFELLWLMGFLPRFTYERQRWSMKKTPDEAYGLYVNRMKTYRDISPEEEQIIVRYLQTIAKDGLICEDVDTTITNLYWQV